MTRPRARTPVRLTEDAPWLVTLTCCGRSNGVVQMPSWDEADKFREAYISGPGVAKHGYSSDPNDVGHRRSAVVSRPAAIRGVAAVKEAR